MPKKKKNILKAALTELPILVRVSWALCTRSSPTLTAKALVIWEENSTEIPTAMTKLTNETAFKVMFHLRINQIYLDNEKEPKMTLL